MSRLIGAAHWDERYRAHQLVWGVAPNRWVVEELAGVPAGRALDLACGEGRNAIWLAGLGWQVTAVDFSKVALERGRSLAGQLPIEWCCEDATNYRPPHPLDLVLMVYLHLPREQRRAALEHSIGALAPGGMVLLIGHDSRNITEGVGGPQEPELLFGPADVREDIATLPALVREGLVVERAEQLLRPVPEAPRPAIDALIRIRRCIPTTPSATEIAAE